jgi:molybdate transport system substrate-binding protein
MVRQLADSYARDTGTSVHLTLGTTGQLRERLEKGERADMIIMSAPAITDAEKAGLVIAGSSTPLGRSGMGVGIRSGAKAPDISTPEALKQSLLAAPAVAYTDPAAGATSGIYFVKLLTQWGIADAIQKKAKTTPGGMSCELVADGRADICAQNVTEILPVKGVTYVGPFPAAVQNYITYTAAIPKNAPSPDAGKSFVAYLTAPSQAAAWHKAGWEEGG